MSEPRRVIPAPRVDWLEQVRIEGERLRGTVEAQADLTREVPACPGWNVGDVLLHLGSVTRVIHGWLSEGRRPQQWERDPGTWSLPAWQHQGLVVLREELEVRGAQDPCATWSPCDQTVRFWRRRLAHEVAVHRVDVEQAYGLVPEVDPELALDGIDEVLCLWLLTRLGRDVGGSGGGVSIRSEGHTWYVGLHPHIVEAWAGDAPSAAVVEGGASELYLWLWGRRPDSAVRIHGDESAVVELREALGRATR